MIMVLIACGHDVGCARQRSPEAIRPRRKLKSRADLGGLGRTNSSHPALPADLTSGSLSHVHTPDEETLPKIVF
jgi:hypothetical protein